MSLSRILGLIFLSVIGISSGVSADSNYTNQLRDYEARMEAQRFERNQREMLNEQKRANREQEQLLRQQNQIMKDKLNFEKYNRSFKK